VSKTFSYLYTCRT